MNINYLTLHTCLSFRLQLLPWFSCPRHPHLWGPDRVNSNRRHGSETATWRSWNDNKRQLLMRNYDTDKEKSEIDSDIRVLKIRQWLAAHSGRRNCILQNETVHEYWQSTVCLILTLFCHLLSFMDHLLYNNLKRSSHFGKCPSKDLHVPAWGSWPFLLVLLF